MVRVSRCGELQWSKYQRYPVRIGTDVFTQGYVSSERVQELTAACIDIARQLERRGITNYRAVGTAALREARNGRRVADIIRHSSGLTIDLIDGQEEAQIARAALVRAVGGLPRSALLFDLGGGTLELARVHNDRSISVPFGAARMLERYPEFNLKVPPARVAALQRTITRDLRRALGTRWQGRLAVGTGGNLEALARWAPKTRAGPPVIAMTKLGAITTRMAALDAKQREARYGLRFDRAQLIMPTLLVLAAVHEVAGIEDIVVPGTGLREGLLLQLMRSLDPRTGPRTVAAALGGNMKAADRRAVLAVQLFAALQPCHRLWPQALSPLMAAIYLHDIGLRIDTENCVPHAQYIVGHASGMGLTADVRSVAGDIVANMFGTRAQHDDVVSKLGALARLALELDACGTRRIVSVDPTTWPVALVVSARKPLPRARLAPVSRLLGARIRRG